ncbi:hypothetical protein ALO43_200484 [Pseudomonas tremae]|uniref:Uncharacterized protein n=1 Tax=Pseudomonas tremae TaxID=200454 RepID=A0AA40P382_9PSED|nr:hypothetical protein ALO43_200484 [Pseudomonas tremae]
MLYDAVGGATARAILVEAFPQGTAEKLIALRQTQVGEADSNNVICTLANELIKRRGYNL